MTVGQVVGGAAFMLACGASWLCSSAQEAAPVVASPVVEEEIRPGQTFVGTLIAARESVVGTAVDGRVEKLWVEEGSAVGGGDDDHTSIGDSSTGDSSTGDSSTGDLSGGGPSTGGSSDGGASGEHQTASPEPNDEKGQPIAELRKTTIGIELEAAIAGAQLAERELRELEERLPSEIEQAEAKLASAEALAAFAAGRYSRTKRLFDLNRSTTEEELDETLNAKTAAEQAVLVAKSALKLVSRDDKIKQAESRLLVAQVNVRRLRDRMEKYTIRAPFQGYVAARHTEVGAWITTGDPVFTVLELDPAEVEVSVPEGAIVGLRQGAEVLVRVDALPSDVIQGSVDRIVPRADRRSRSFPVRVRFPNPRDEQGNPRAMPGMLCRVTLPVGRPRKALLVHKDALVLKPDSPPAVIMVGDDSKAVIIPVELGVSRGSRIQVITPSGSLVPGRLVVIRGNERIRPGQPLQVVRRERDEPDPSTPGG